MSCEHSISKFQDEITHYLWELSLESGHDDECGESGQNGWYALFDGPVIESSETIGNIAARGEGYGSLTAWDICELVKCEGAILEQHDSGAVYSTLYYASADLTNAWSAVRDDSAQCDGDSASDDA